jgi:hypothetical protein
MELPARVPESRILGMIGLPASVFQTCDAVFDPSDVTVLAAAFAVLSTYLKNPTLVGFPTVCEGIYLQRRKCCGS